MTLEKCLRQIWRTVLTEKYLSEWDKIVLRKEKISNDDLVKILEDNHKAVSDYSLKYNLREFTVLVHNIDFELFNKVWRSENQWNITEAHNGTNS